MKKLLTIILLILISQPTQVDADRPSVATTARSIALGGTVIGLSNDASTTFWNPSGIALLQRQEVAFSYADRFGLGLNNSFTSYVFPLFERHAVGIDWLRESFGDTELKDALNIINIGYGFQLHRSLSVGVGAKSVLQSIDLDGVSLRSASGFGFDAGLVLKPKSRPFDKFRIGLTIQDIGGTKVRDNKSQFEEELLEQNVRGGIAYQATRDLTLAADVDQDNIYFGTEYQPIASLILRGGLNRALSQPNGADNNLAFALGFGVKYNSIQLDYAFENHPILPATHHATVSLSYNASVINIKDAMIRPAPIFKSLYRTYEASDFVDVVLRNSSSDPLPVTVSIEVPTLTDAPHEEMFTLPPQSTERYGMKLTFPQDLLSTQPSYYDNLVQPTVKVSYLQGRRSKTATKTLSSVYVLGKGKLSWSNPSRIAAFITPESRTVDTFARGLVGQYADRLKEKFGNNNVGKAALIFDAIGAYGLRYQQDQTTPYIEISENDSVFDTVKYPYEYLEAKIGDCDDCTALFCSMLENLNIPTAILDVNDPEYGHIYMMFDSGVSVENAGDFFLNEREYVLWDNRIWIPVETTLFGSSFSDAWRNGAEEYHIRKERGFINEILVSEAQQTFRPGVVPDSDIEVPAAAQIAELFERDLAFFDNRLDRIALSSGVSLDSAEGLYDAGAAYLRLSQLERAETSFTDAIKMDPTMADAYNALGVVQTRRRRYDEAIELYTKALELNSNDAGFRINIALTYHLQGRSEDAEQAYQLAVVTNSDFAGVLDFLSGDGAARAGRVDPLQKIASEKAYDDGAAFLRLNRLEKATEALDRALSLDPNNADAMNAKGVIATRERRYDEAVAMYQQATNVLPGVAGFHANIAITYHLQGKEDVAIRSYRKAVELDESYDGHLDFITGGQPLESVEVKSMPQSKTVGPLQKIASEKAYDDGAAFLRLARFDRAVEQFDRALSLNPNNSDALNGKGVVATHQRNYDEAVRMFVGASTRNPETSGFLINLAIVYHLQGDAAKATEAYRKAIALDSGLAGQLEFLEP
ncbi:MAG: PorV/PorQ family protein [Candidatus Latescibacterota bacterium]|nr:PorV/PorQ family protein [Candidatus Latescibacterota bacterium]